MAKADQLKDLEGLILGVVAESQPCSPYFVHKNFLRSPSKFFSGSAGAIYPAVKRLEKKGFLKGATSGTRGKPSKSLTITKTGLAEYLSWYFDPSRAADAGFDPLRARISMLGALPRKERKEVLGRLIDICRNRLALLARLTFDLRDGAGMDRALEIEKAALKTKLALLLKWQNQAGD